MGKKPAAQAQQMTEGKASKRSGIRFDDAPRCPACGARTRRTQPKWRVCERKHHFVHKMR